MDDKKYKKIVDKYTPKENKIKNYMISFISGGTMGFLGELLIKLLIEIGIEREKASVLMIITIIFISVLLTSIGVFSKLVRKLRSGLLIPISGFAHSIEASFIDYKSEGWIKGVGASAFHLAGSVIITGVVASISLALIRIMVGVL